jgi:thiamine-phosphate pyrophosphorylase
LYFVVDASEPSAKLLEVVEAAVRGGVDIVQIWSVWKEREPMASLIMNIHKITEKHGVPLIINNDLEMAKIVKADGVHLDSYEITPQEVRKGIGESCIVGYTIGNDISRAKWAQKEDADYISFCSIYPSPSVQDCEIVPLETVRRTRRLVDLPIFASGGINVDNAGAVLEAGADGIAVISGIQRAGDPEVAARQFKEIIRSTLERKLAQTA